MIKLSIKIITLASLTVGLGLYFVPRNVFSLPSNIIKSTKVENNIIPVVLPDLATVTLKTDSTMSGKVTAFDQQQSEITIQASGQSRKIGITDIKQIEFKGNAKLIHSGEIVIRGGNNNSNQNNRETWQEPLNHFKITNAQDGKAEVILSNVSERKLEGIVDVSETNTYVVDQLGFNHDNNNIILTVIPYSE